MKQEAKNGKPLMERVKMDRRVEEVMESMRADILEDVHRRMEAEARMNRFRTRRWLVAASLALLVVLSGWLMWQSELFREVHPVEFAALPGEKSTVTLPDGTLVLLNGGTRLSYDASAFGKKSRSVSLDGEAFFDVTKNRKVPFIVNSGKAQVEVLGTRFNVEGYSVDAAVRVTLESGKVSMQIAGTPHTCVLEPGQQAVYDKQGHRLVRRQVKVDEVTAWRNDEMYFDDMPLGEIARRLERRFDVSVVIRSDELRQSRYNGAFTAEDNLERILSFLALMDGRLCYEVHGSVVSIDKKK